MIRLNEVGAFDVKTKVEVLSPDTKKVISTGTVIRYVIRAGHNLLYSITGQESLIPSDRVRISKTNLKGR